MKTIKHNAIHKILLVSFSNIGDAVLSLPVLDALCAQYPDARKDVIVGERSMMVFEPDKRIHTLHLYQKKNLSERIKFWNAMRLEKYDLVIDLRKSIFSVLGKCRSPFNYPNPAKHKRDIHLNSLRALGIPLQLSEAREDTPAMSEGSLVVIAPGSKSHIKQWPKEYFAELANRLVENARANVVWIGDKNDKVLIEEIKALMHQPSKNVAGDIAWSESVQLIRRAQLVISNDSSPLHVADHYHKKVISFFGPTSPVLYGPQRTQEGALFRNKFCSPCAKAQCRFNLECMTEITVDEATKLALRLLGDAVEHDAEKILVIRLDRLGDTILSLPAVDALRARFPKSKITAMTRPYTQAIMEQCPSVDRTLAYDYAKGGKHRSLKGYWRLLREVSSQQYDMVFVLHPTLRAHVLSYLSGIPYRIGIDTKMGFLLTHKIMDLRSEGHQHESKNALDVVRAFGVLPSAEQSVLSVSGSDERMASALMPHNDYVVMHAGSSSPSKCWPKQSFFELGKQIIEEWGTHIILIGDRREKELNAGLAERLGDKCMDLTSKTTIPVVAALFKKAQLFIANDSGPVHLASNLGTPVLSIFGRKQKGLNHRRWRPMGAASRIAYRDIGCVQCLAEACPIDFECLSALTVEDVMKEARFLYNGASNENVKS